jgi:uncharacterized protein YaiL (DUF2058 family)
MSSLSDQLLKAGLVTEDQVKKAAEKPKKVNKNIQKKTRNNRPHKFNKEASDLAQFYKQRATLEKNEEQEEQKKKLEAQKIKKETNDKINKLILDNLLNVDEASIRYNFIVGTTIKYLFVTAEQQQKLADGDIAITFMGGKRSLIPLKTAMEIRKLNPNKIVIVASENSDSDTE